MDLKSAIIGFCFGYLTSFILWFLREKLEYPPKKTEEIPRFSIVCPIKDEVDLIPVTLPSFYSVNPSEVILCLDKPAPKKVTKMIKKVAKACNAEDKTRIIEVERRPDYRFHQAWVRRKGFLEAENDIILTTDIHLIINRNVLKAVKLVGKNNIGLVSLSKFEYPNSIISFLRMMSRGILKIIHKIIKMGTVTGFTGLYCIYRPYWLDSEPEEGIKNLVNPKQKLRMGIRISKDFEVYRDIFPAGEDTYLRDCMEKKHRVIYLPDTGATVLTNPLESHPDIQYCKGIYFAFRGRKPLVSIGRALIRFEPYYLCGYLYGRRLLSVLSQKMTYSLDKARKYWEYAPTSIGHFKTSSKELISMSDDELKRFIERSIEYRNLIENAQIYRKKVSNWIRNEKCKKMLDFGCGFGQDGVYFSKTLGIEVTFADIVKNSVKLTDRYNRIWNIKTKSIYISSDPKDFRFPEVYDVIFANGVLHHTPEAREIVKNLTRFLKPKGLFICMLYTPKHFKSRHVKTIKEYALASEGSAPLLNPYTDYYNLEKAKMLFKGYVLLESFTTNKGKFGWYVWKKK